MFLPHASPLPISPSLGRELKFGWRLQELLKAHWRERLWGKFLHHHHAPPAWNIGPPQVFCCRVFWLPSINGGQNIACGRIWSPRLLQNSESLSDCHYLLLLQTLGIDCMNMLPNCNAHPHGYTHIFVRTLEHFSRPKALSLLSQMYEM